MPSRNSITCWTYLSKCNASFLDDKVKRASKEIDGLKKKIEVLTANQQKAADPQYQLSAEYFRIKEYSDALIARIVEKVIVLSADEIKIEFVHCFLLSVPYLSPTGHGMPRYGNKRIIL